MKQKSKSILKCIMTFVLTVVMVLGAVPLPFMPASMVVYADGKELSGSESYTAQDGDVLTGSTSGTVTIADGAKITLNNATITGGIVCEGSATITLVGTNNVTGAYQKAGIQIGGSGTTLTINGDGSLTANGAMYAAGIGLNGAWNVTEDVIGGNIVIESGIITANGGVGAAGIGAGYTKDSNNSSERKAIVGNITIKGGTVTAVGVKAVGGNGADGIGAGDNIYNATYQIGTVTIYDDIDKVDASSISESVTYMHVDGNTETDVTANASTYFTITEDGNRRVIAPKDDTDYTITIANGIEHGSLTGAATAKYMEKVTITATPDLGYRLSRLVVKDADNNDVATTGNTFLMPKGDVTVSAVFEQGVHGTTEFAWGYFVPSGFVREASIYDGVTTVNLRSGISFTIGHEDVYGRVESKFLLDNYIDRVDIPYAGGTGTFTEFENGTNFYVDYNGESGFYDITMTDVGNGKWSVSILKTVPVVADVPDQTYTGSEITPEPQVMAGSLSLNKGTDYEYSYENNVNAGTAKVTVTFKGDYASLGSVEKEFTIVSPHIHSFDYSVEGATITATCSAADCPLTDNKATLTINAPIKTIYGDANSASATLTGLDDFNSATSLNITETGIKYVGRGNTTYAESDTAPVNAGTYTASITAGSKTASVDYIIAPKPLNVTGITASDKIYDGTVEATISANPVLDGIVGSDDVSVTAGKAEFKDANAGTAKEIVLTGFTLSGNDKDNYELKTTATANITPKEITVSGIKAQNKSYDGTTTASLDYTGVTFNGKLDADALTVTATGAFSSKEAGTDKNVTITNLTLGGASAGNYKLANDGNQTSAKASITACVHAKTEVRNKVDATKTSKGYTGDTYCKTCGKLLSKGKDVNKLPDDKDKDADKKVQTSYSNEWVDGKWYDKNGKQSYKYKGSWKKNSKGWWFEDENEWCPYSQWQKIDGKWYYFTDEGYMDYSEYRDGCWLGSDGAWVEAYSSGTWHYSVKGWWYSDGSWYAADQDLWIDGTKYHFNSKGYWKE